MAVIATVFKKLLKFMKWFFIISIISVIIFRFIPIPITPTMIYLLGEQAFDSERKLVLKKDWESLSNISPNMKLAVIASEDQLFYEHYGFDFAAIKKAIRNNEKGRRLKGGSTISQQTAKNAFLLPHRNYLRKGLEAYFTMLIELLWSKDRIIEVYLNVIEFGNGIYGVEAASQYYFKKSASKLTKDEASLLAAVLPNPIRYKVDNPSSYILRRKNWIKRQISKLGIPTEIKN
ncbi:MAG: monofunctional biosynthetic peptidoglycan transglycosylase [Chitinophagales bacterium]|nr:monofunctional biosynthetic peptidoglycan transglycosylase [Chitinophagales bacterium]